MPIRAVSNACGCDFPMQPRASDWFAAQPTLIRTVLLAGLGAVAALGQAPTDLWWLTILALAVAFALLARPEQRRAFWPGWALGVGYFAVSLRWIVSPFLVHIERDGWMAPFALILMAAGFALFWGLAHWIALRVLRGGVWALCLTIMLAELTRSLILTGFPWALVGHALIPTPLVQLAGFGGPHLLTLVVLGLAAALASVRLAQVGAALIAGAVAWVTLIPAPIEPATDQPVVRLIQPNAPQEEKWDPFKSQIFFDRMIGFTGEGAVPDLVVWPESAIAMLLNYAGEALTQVSDAARGAPLIVGVNREEQGLYYNSFVHLGRGGEIAGFYDKQHLVPFGEFIPGGDVLHEIGIRGFGSSYGGGFTAGRGLQQLTIPGIGPIRPLICYEGIFSEEIGGSDDRPRALVLITNDAWFGKGAGPFQHLAQARLRAIEQGLPMVRVANTGVSAMIDSAGRITGSIDLNTAGYLDVALPAARARTVYSRLGDYPISIVLALFSGMLWWRNRHVAVDRTPSDA